MSHVAWSVCVCVRHTDVLCKTDEPQVSYFGVWTRVDLRNHCDGGADPPSLGNGHFGGGDMCPTVVTRLRMCVLHLLQVMRPLVKLQYPMYSLYV